MKCFNHLENDAVGTCKSCCRGLCKECAELVNRSMACKAECVADVQAINEILSRSKNTIRVTGSAYKRNAALYFAMSAAFAIFGYQNPQTSWVDYPLVIIFVIAGLYQLKTAKELVRK